MHLTMLIGKILNKFINDQLHYYFFFYRQINLTDHYQTR